MAEQTGGSEEDAGTLPDLSDVTNVLFLAPSVGSQSSGAFELLTQSPPATTNLIVVSFTETAQGWVEDWNATVGTTPARGGIVSVGERTSGLDEQAWTVRTIENPSDLTGIGIELSELLSGAAAAEDETTVF